MYEFEWGINKSRENEKKHSISFDEAVSIFGDPLAAYFEDEEHSSFEHRSKIIGTSSQGKSLIVVFTERGKKLEL